jgi:hypothetical protein
MISSAGRGIQLHRFRREAAMRRVRARVVVVESPALDHGARLGQVREDLLVQALVAQLGRK